jgi:hypothetical protein
MFFSLENVNSFNPCDKPVFKRDAVEKIKYMIGSMYIYILPYDGCKRVHRPLARHMSCHGIVALSKY